MERPNRGEARREWLRAGTGWERPAAEQQASQPRGVCKKRGEGEGEGLSQARGGPHGCCAHSSVAVSRSPATSAGAAPSAWPRGDRRQHPGSGGQQQGEQWTLPGPGSAGTALVFQEGRLAALRQSSRHCPGATALPRGRSSCWGRLWESREVGVPEATDRKTRFIAVETLALPPRPVSAGICLKTIQGQGR